MKNNHLAIFASGSGTNAENIINYFQHSENVNVDLVLCNKPNAGVLSRAKKLGITHQVFNREEFYNSDKVVELLQEKNIDWIILAGFLWLVPKNLLKAFPDKIINIHPALLPKYGGKGMYGSKVHEAVVENKEVETGVTIHFVNEVYDDGKTIFQATCKVEDGDTPDMVANKVHALEYEHFPRVIEELIVGAK